MQINPRVAMGAAPGRCIEDQFPRVVIGQAEGAAQRGLPVRRQVQGEIRARVAEHPGLPVKKMRHPVAVQKNIVRMAVLAGDMGRLQEVPGDVAVREHAFLDVLPQVFDRGAMPGIEIFLAFAAAEELRERDVAQQMAGRSQGPHVAVTVAFDKNHIVQAAQAVGNTGMIGDRPDMRVIRKFRQVQQMQANGIGAAGNRGTVEGFIQNGPRRQRQHFTVLDITVQPAAADAVEHCCLVQPVRALQDAEAAEGFTGFCIAPQTGQRPAQPVIEVWVVPAAAGDGGGIGLGRLFPFPGRLQELRGQGLPGAGPGNILLQEDSAVLFGALQDGARIGTVLCLRLLLLLLSLGSGHQAKESLAGRFRIAGFFQHVAQPVDPIGGMFGSSLHRGLIGGSGPLEFLLPFPHEAKAEMPVCHRRIGGDGHAIEPFGGGPVIAAIMGHAGAVAQLSIAGGGGERIKIGRGGGRPIAPGGMEDTNPEPSGGQALVGGNSLRIGALSGVRRPAAAGLTGRGFEGMPQPVMPLRGGSAACAGDGFPVGLSRLGRAAHGFLCLAEAQPVICLGLGGEADQRFQCGSFLPPFAPPVQAGSQRVMGFGDIAQQLNHLSGTFFSLFPVARFGQLRQMLLLFFRIDGSCWIAQKPKQ